MSESLVYLTKLKSGAIFQCNPGYSLNGMGNWAERTAFALLARYPPFRSFFSGRIERNGWELVLIWYIAVCVFCSTHFLATFTYLALTSITQGSFSTKIGRAHV